jgi:hypothetical protein
MPTNRAFQRPGCPGRLPFLLALVLAGCSGSATAAHQAHLDSSETAGADYAAPAMPGADVPAQEAQVMASAPSPTAAPRRRWFQREATSELMAAATPKEAQEPAPAEAPAMPEQKPQTATDATQAGPILVYTASFLLSVYEVEKAQLALKAATQKLGGFISVQNDTQITLRVPADKFEDALTAVETTGKVRARNVQALDVGDEYRDLGIRLRTAEAVRTRLEAMLARAEKIDDALRVEQELERVVREIELLKGQLRSLGDRIAFSTLVVEFRPEARPDIDDSDVFRLPYPWLDELGLHHLLELTP